ncbi:reverse transcriptase zinc-binding domain-containing protein [Artemisia annua]|uniref:Reverse transcriptase zinc-binding domain-containing protein n=1 Tax=Artemisia annua TaxID=35608 RepID=A0A2U1PFL8_ARTAN|nr:reverse transcriptase zinc-binding domain-containing protein [Artemisia annua]
MRNVMLQNDYLCGRNIWEVTVENNASWGWRKLMKLRDMVRPRIWHYLGNVENTSVWYDTWDKVGPLSKTVTRRQIYNAHLSNEATVADMVVNGSLQLPKEWVHQHAVLNHISNLTLIQVVLIV